MADIRELSFCELKRKEVVNVGDGRKLGHIVDMVFTASDGKVQGIVAPYGRRFLFFPAQEVYIPYKSIKTIGEDIILVDICIEFPDKKGHINFDHSEKKEHTCSKTDASACPDCDNRCDKCMLFDCAYRWKKRKNGIFVDNHEYK